MLVHGNDANDHGNDDQLSLNTLFLHGKHHFVDALDRETICVTENNASTNEILVLLKEEVLPRQKNMMRYVIGQHVTHQLLSASTLHQGTRTCIEHRIL